MPNDLVVHSDPEILGGTPVFMGTRVPVKNLVDYIQAGDSLETFLDAFPSVSREMATVALKQAGELLIASVVPTVQPGQAIEIPGARSAGSAAS